MGFQVGMSILLGIRIEAIHVYILTNIFSTFFKAVSRNFMKGCLRIDGLMNLVKEILKQYSTKTVEWLLLVVFSK